MRPLEPMRVGMHVLPKNSLLTGESRIQGERLNIGIVQVEHDGIIIPVELTVYDNDGQGGIFIPGSMEANAVKEVAANMGQNLGTSISITNQSPRTSCFPNSDAAPFRGCRSTLPRNYARRRYT